MRLLPLFLLLCPSLLAQSLPILSTNDLPRLSATEPTASLRSFVVKEGFRLDLVAAEPLVVDPVAFCFDEYGRLFVAEMRDYSEHREEKLGRIRRLEDTNGDGIFDKSTVYAENLAWPTGIICYDGGVFVSTTPDLLYLKDTKKDGIADLRQVAFTGFAAGQEKLNVQSLFNSLTWGPDNRIHGASGGSGGKIRNPLRPSLPSVDVRTRDFSFDPVTREIRAESGGGQYGIAFDNWGRKYVCSNSSHARAVLYDDAYANRSLTPPQLSPTLDIAVEGPAAEIYRISPDERWRVIRTKWRLEGISPGLLEGGGRVSGYFSGATGLTIFRGDAWGPSFVGDLFVADCGANIIHHKKLSQTNGLPTAARPSDEQRREFIASRDNWFRPVQLSNGPDGNLYVADMYREVIEHPWSLPEPIKKLVDLDSGNDRGRLYRIAREDYRYQPPVLPGRASFSELIALLDHPNGWHRDTASRLIIEKLRSDTATGLHAFLKKATTPWGKIHALHLLANLQDLSPQEVKSALYDDHAAVRVHGIKVSETLMNSDSPPVALSDSLASLSTDPDPEIRTQLALSASFFPRRQAEQCISRLLEGDWGNPWILNAVLMSAHQCADRLLITILENPQRELKHVQFAKKLAPLAAANATPEQLKTLLNRLPINLSLSDSIALTQSLLTKSSPTLAREILLGAPILNQAKNLALDASAPASLRATAIQLLAYENWDRIATVFRELLAGPLPSACLTATALTLHEIPEPAATELLLNHLLSFDTKNRFVALEPFLRRPDKFKLFSQTLDSKSPTPQLSLTELSLIADARRRYAPENPQPTEGNKQDVYNHYTPSLTLKGDPAMGRVIFEQRCAACHRFKEIGSAVGPDLTGVKSNPKEVILNSIVDPNREVAARFQSLEATTDDGETHLGLVASETEKTITLRSPSGLETTLQRNKIKTLQIRRESLMPTGLEAGLDQSAMASLLEFIVN